MLVLQEEMWSASNLTKSNTATMKQKKNLSSTEKEFKLYTAAPSTGWYTNLNTCVFKSNNMLLYFDQ